MRVGVSGGMSIGEKASCGNGAVALQGMDTLWLGTGLDLVQLSEGEFQIDAGFSVTNTEDSVTNDTSISQAQTDEIIFGQGLDVEKISECVMRVGWTGGATTGLCLLIGVTCEGFNIVGSGVKLNFVNGLLDCVSEVCTCVPDCNDIEATC